MRFTALLFLAVLTGALVCAQDQKSASAPGSANPSHEGSAVSNENAESSGSAKPSRKQRSSLTGKCLCQCKEAVGNVNKQLNDIMWDEGGSSRLPVDLTSIAPTSVGDPPGPQ
uniref:Uncharacterized protein n=1 Tax=Propithecus coquereli TaxID=379532 RepID=A0A2K6GQ47_PROCO